MSSVPAADTKIDNNLGEFSISRLDIHIVHTKIFLPISAEHSAGNAIFFSVRLLLKSLLNGKLNESLVAMHGQVAGTKTFSSSYKGVQGLEGHVPLR